MHCTFLLSHFLDTCHQDTEELSRKYVARKETTEEVVHSVAQRSDVLYGCTDTKPVNAHACA